MPTAREIFGAALQGGQISRTKLHTRTVTIMKRAHFSGVSTVQGTLDFYSGGRNEGSVRCVILHPTGTTKTMGVHLAVYSHFTAFRATR